MRRETSTPCFVAFGRGLSPRIGPAIFRAMRRIACLLTLASQAGVPASAQNGATVQLPTFRYFTTNSSALVPDRGGAALGGMNRAASGRSEFGAPLLPWKQRATGTATSHAGTSASVYIHDFEALEAELLGRRPGEEPSADASPPAAAATQNVAHASNAATKTPAERRAAAVFAGTLSPGKDARLPSVAEIRAERARQRVARAEEAEALFQRGSAAEKSGSPGAARGYYHLAAQRAEGERKRVFEAAALRLAASQRKNVAAAAAP